MLQVDDYVRTHGHEESEDWLQWLIWRRELNAELESSELYQQWKRLPRALRDLVQVSSYADIMSKGLGVLYSGFLAASLFPLSKLHVMLLIPKPEVQFPSSAGLATSEAACPFYHQDRFLFYPDVPFRYVPEMDGGDGDEGHRLWRRQVVPFVPLDFKPFIEWLGGAYSNPCGFMPHGEKLDDFPDEGSLTQAEL